MTARPSWKGHLRLSLVSFAVQLYPAIGAASKITFHQVQRGTGLPVHEQKVVPGQGEVANDEIVKGYEYEKGHYLLLEEQDFQRVHLETRKTIELNQFVTLAEIDPLYFDKPYYAAPDGPIADEAYAVLREALRRTGKAALGRVLLSGHERQVVLVARDKGFVLYTLHPHELVRSASTIFADVQDPRIEEEQIEIARQLVGHKLGRFDPASFVDRYEEALKKIIQEKLAGREPVAVEDAPSRRTADLTEALKRSLIEQSGETAGTSAVTGQAGEAKSDRVIRKKETAEPEKASADATLAAHKGAGMRSGRGKGAGES